MGMVIQCNITAQNDTLLKTKKDNKENHQESLRRRNPLMFASTFRCVTYLSTGTINH